MDYKMYFVRGLRGNYTIRYKPDCYNILSLSVPYVGSGIDWQSQSFHRIIWDVLGLCLTGTYPIYGEDYSYKLINIKHEKLYNRKCKHHSYRSFSYSNILFSFNQEFKLLDVIRNSSSRFYIYLYVFTI